MYDQPDAASVAAQYDRILDALAQKLPAVADHLDTARADVLAFSAFPKELWRQIWSNTPRSGSTGDPAPNRRRGDLPRPQLSDPPGRCGPGRTNTTNGSKDAATSACLHQATVASPHLLLLVDELATLTAFAERKVMSRFDHALGLLLTQGRACGISVVSAVQDPGKDVVGWRDLFPTRVALRLDNPVQVDMVLGDGARDRGARADHISELTPGVAYIRTVGTRQVQRVRSSYLSDADIDDLMGAAAAPLDPVLADLEADLEGGSA